MFEEALKDNPLLSYTILVLILSGILAIIRGVVVFYTKGVDTASKTDFIKAAETGSFDECNKMIDAGTDINQTTKLGNTALIRACRNGQLEIVKLLVSRGADINRQGEENNNALMNAIFHDKESTYEIVKFLIENGADINLVNKEYATALSLSVVYNNSTLFELLIKNGAAIDQSSILTAVKNNRKEMLSRLIELGADINMILAGINKSLLRIAVEDMNEEMVKFLLEKGADLYSKDLNGVTVKEWGTNFAYPNSSIKKIIKEAAAKHNLSEGGNSLESDEWECADCKTLVKEDDKICPKCGAIL